MALMKRVKSLKRRVRKSTKDIEEYKPSLYPSFTIYSNDGIKLSMDEKEIDKIFNAKVKFTGINKQTKANKKEIDYTFEILSIEE